MKLLSLTFFILFLSTSIENWYPEKVVKGTEIIFRAATSMRGDIRKGDKKENVMLFNELAEFLNKNNDWLFSYEVHVDHRGNSESNLALTEMRAKNTVYSLENFFGVSQGQLIPKGMGESNPIISSEEIALLKTKEEKENAHQINRRTVIRALKKR